MSYPFLFAGSHTAKDIHNTLVAGSPTSLKYAQGHLDLYDLVAVEMELNKLKDLEQLMSQNLDMYAPQGQKTVFYVSVKRHILRLHNLLKPCHRDEFIHFGKQLPSSSSVNIPAVLSPDFDDICKRILQIYSPILLETLIVQLCDQLFAINIESKDVPEDPCVWNDRRQRYIKHQVFLFFEEVFEAFYDVIVRRLEELMEAHVKAESEEEAQMGLPKALLRVAMRVCNQKLDGGEGLRWKFWQEFNAKVSGTMVTPTDVDQSATSSW